MSVQGQDPETDVCGVCDDEYEIPSAAPRGYCSDECYYAEKGNAALRQIDSDHTLCASCFRYIKTTSAPSQTWLEDRSDKVQTALDNGGSLESDESGQLTLDVTDATDTRQTAAGSIVGFQHTTEHTSWGSDIRETDCGNELVYQRWICSCGNVDVGERDEILASLDLQDTLTNLLQRLYELNSRGAIGGDFDHTEFLDAFDKEDLNWSYAIGRGLYS